MGDQNRQDGEGSGVLGADHASDSVPRALGPAYRLGHADTAIELYRGSIEIDLGTGSEQREAVAVLAWIPKPHIAIHSQGPLSLQQMDQLNALTLKFPELGVTTDVQVIHFQGTPGDCTLTVAPLCNLGIGQPSGFSSVLFHVVNLRDFHGGDLVRHVHDTSTVHGVRRRMSTGNRMVLEAEDWKVTLDNVVDQGEVIASLRSRGGHAITYVGRMSKTDCTPFGMEDLEGMAELIDSFLSFLNGVRCSIVLPVAFDVEGNEVWRGWNSGQHVPWENMPSWSENLPLRWLSPAFPGFFRRWHDPEWHEPIGLVIDWYLQAKRGSVETALMLGQSALELLGYVQFVEATGSTMSGGAYEKLNASERIRKLLVEHGVKTDMPGAIPRLGSMEFEGKPFDDGPHAITSIRNGIAHPKKTKRKQVLGPNRVERVQAANLCLYYLECVLLNLFDHAKFNFIPANTLFNAR